MTDKNRLYYLDNLKVFLIIFVIVHHVGQAYGATGGVWYYSYPGERVKALGLFFFFNASFFMGLFFFISGYFYPQSFDRHGVYKFIQDKFIRFGIPLIFAYLIMNPLLEYVKYVHYVNPISLPDFYSRIWHQNGLSLVYPGGFHFGHLWFVEHLLVYAILYSVLRTVLKKSLPSLSVSTTRQAGVSIIIFYILLLGLITYFLRTSGGFPTDRWIAFLGFIQMEPAHIPQYLSLFVFGILAYRWSFLNSITTPRNILWLLPGLGVFIFTVVQLYIMGSRQQAFFLREYKEALLCVGVCIGLLALFKTFFNQTGSIMHILSENAFGAYIIHVPVVVAFQYAFDPFQADAFTLFVIVSLLSIPGSFLLSILLRFIPGMKRVL